MWGRQSHIFLCYFHHVTQNISCSNLMMDNITAVFHHCLQNLLTEKQHIIFYFNLNNQQIYRIHRISQTENGHYLQLFPIQLPCHCRNFFERQPNIALLNQIQLVQILHIYRMFMQLWIQQGHPNRPRIIYCFWILPCVSVYES